ncbi:MAG: hypothetical protein PVI75_07875 [Gammaproteobacteria bacterium]|jgi:hypothetical protein
MKKMQKLAFLCLLSCPLALFAAQPNVFDTPNIADVSSVQQAQDAQKNQEDQNLNIDGGMLGLKGPFSLSTIYSKTFGLILEGKYTQLLNSSNVLVLELDGGKAERRIGATWGHVLTPNQRIKLTAEDLSQKMNFDFDSGNVSKWVYQNAIGGTYEYLLPYKLIKDFNLNAYYSKANSQDLGSKDFTTSGVLFRNYRRIAGATDQSVSAGIDISPMKSTLIGLQLNYDNIKYDMRYQQASNQNDAGLGATISLHQLVNDRLQFSLLASDRKSYKDYQAEVDWLLNSVPGSQLQLGLVGEKIDANFGLPNDERVGLQLSYSWGGDSTGQPMTFSDPVPSNDASGLKDWTSTPAVHMSQVLAIKDQKTERINSKTKTASKDGLNESGDFHYNKDYYHDLPITVGPIHSGDEIHLKYGDQAHQDTCPPLFINQSPNVYGMDISYNGLPKSGDLKVTVTPWKQSGYQIGNNLIKIDGTPTQADFNENPDHCIDIKITAHKMTHGKEIDTAVATIKIKPDVVAPTIALHNVPYVVNVGQSINHFDLATVTANEGTVDPDTIKLDPDLSSHGIILDPAYKTDCKDKTSCEIYLKADKVTNAMDKTQIKLHAENTDGGKSDEPFDVTIKLPKNPSIDLHATSYVVNEGQSIDHSDLATVTANEGTVDPDTIKLDPDLSSHGIILDPAYKTECKDKTSCEIYLKADKVTNAMDKTQIKLHAENTGGGKFDAPFDVTINPAQKPTITLDNQNVPYVTTEGAVVNHVHIATVTANEGNVDPDAISLVGEEHGLMLDPAYKTDCAGKPSCEIYLKGAATGAMFDQPETVTLNAGNTIKCSDSKSFNVTVKGTPEAKDADLGFAGGNRGQQVVLVPGLKNHFKNPIGSGNLTFQFKDSQGNDIQSTYGLSMSGNDLIANLPSTAPEGKIDIYVWAKNDVGAAKSAAVYHLYVDAQDIVLNLVHSDFTFTEGQKINLYTVGGAHITQQYHHVAWVRIVPLGGAGKTLKDYNLKLHCEYMSYGYVANIYFDLDDPSKGVQNPGVSQTFRVSAADNSGNVVTKDLTVTVK